MSRKNIFIFILNCVMIILLRAENIKSGQGTHISGNKSLIHFVEYRSGGMKTYSDAEAWIFADKNCPGCDYLKNVLLPELFLEDADNAELSTRIVVEVDLNKKENLLMLLDIEENLKIDSPGNAPVLYWKNKLYYGNKAVRKLIETYKDEK